MEKTFEASLSELETVVRELENGDLPLEQSLKLFEDGVRLSRECREKLAAAERRIEVLTRDGDGRLILQDLNVASAGIDDRAKVKRIVFNDDADE